MDQQEQFISLLEEVKKLAEEYDGVLGTEDIAEVFSQIDLSKEQFDMIYQYLLHNKIEIADYEKEQSVKKREEDTKEEDSIYLKMYVKDLKNVKKLSELEEKELLKLAGKEDNAAKARLTEGYLRIVVDLAKTYRGQGVLLEDLIQEGNIGLMNAVEEISHCSDEEEAKEYIIQEISAAMEAAISERNDSLESEEQFLNELQNINEQIKQLTRDLEREPMPEEVAEKTGKSVEEIEELVKILEQIPS